MLVPLISYSLFFLGMVLNARLQGKRLMTMRGTISIAALFLLLFLFCTYQAYEQQLKYPLSGNLFKPSKEDE